MTDNTSLQDQYNSLQQMYATLESDLGTLYNAYPPDYAGDPSLQYEEGLIPVWQSVAAFAQSSATYIQNYEAAEGTTAATTNDLDVENYVLNDAAAAITTLPQHIAILQQQTPTALFDYFPGAWYYNIGSDLQQAFLALPKPPSGSITITATDANKILQLGPTPTPFTFTVTRADPTQLQRSRQRCPIP